VVASATSAVEEATAVVIEREAERERVENNFRTDKSSKSCYSLSGRNSGKCKKGK
jgi:hypothetical protein